MSVLLVENDFKSIFETIKDVSVFLNVVDLENLEIDCIKQILEQSHYIEKLIAKLVERGLMEIFEIKLNEFLTKNGTIISLSIRQLEKLCDEILSKILTLVPSQEIVIETIKGYLSLLNYERFEEVIKRLSEFRSLFVKLSHVMKQVIQPHDIECALLIQSWLKILDSTDNGEEVVESIVRDMFGSSTCSDILIATLALESSSTNKLIQNIVLNVIMLEVSNSPCCPSWISILQSAELGSLVKKFDVLLDSVFITFQFMGNRYKFDAQNKMWVSSSTRDIDFSNFVEIFKSLYCLNALHYKLKKFIKIQKIKGNREFWEHFELAIEGPF